MAQNYRRAVFGMGAAGNNLPPAPDGSIDAFDRRHLAGLFRGHGETNLRRNLAGVGLAFNCIAPLPDGQIAPDEPDGSDLRHLAGVWRRAARRLLPWQLFFGRNG